MFVIIEDMDLGKRFVTLEKYEWVKNLYINGVPCLEIEEVTGCNHESIRRWMREDGIIRAVQLRYRHIEKPKVAKKGKYDHLLEEPICSGKDYKQYLRDGH